MKRLFLALFFIGVAFIVWYLLENADTSKKTSIEKVETNQSISQIKTNLTSSKIITQTQILQPFKTNGLAEKLLSVTSATNLFQWTNALPGLHLLNPSKYDESWVFDARDSNIQPAVLLVEENGKSIQYESDFINIQVRKNHIRRIEVHSPNLNIEDIKSLGDSLLQVMGKDNADFTAWCDKVGNNWVDQPQFSSTGSSLPDDKSYGFQMWPTFNNEKPWYMLLIIADR